MERVTISAGRKGHSANFLNKQPSAVGKGDLRALPHSRGCENHQKRVPLSLPGGGHKEGIPSKKLPTAMRIKAHLRSQCPVPRQRGRTRAAPGPALRPGQPEPGTLAGAPSSLSVTRVLRLPLLAVVRIT